MKRISELLRMPIVTVAEGIRLGRIDGVELDPTAGRIVYLRFEGEAGHRNGVVPWSAIRAVGADAVTIDSVASVQEGIGPAVREGLTSHVGDRPVVTESGERLGTVTEYDIDETSGAIVSYHVARGGLWGRLTGSEITFPHDAIRAFGRDAIVVSDEAAAGARGGATHAA